MRVRQGSSKLLDLKTKVNN